MSISSKDPKIIKYDLMTARSKIFSMIIDTRDCINSTKLNALSNILQLKTEEYQIGELQDILVPSYLKIYHKHNEKTGKEGLTLLECWKIVLESETYAKKFDKVDVLKKLVACTRAVSAFLRLMPAHKLIGEKSKLNLAFDIEFRIMDKFDQTEFKTRHLIKEQNLGNFFTDNGNFSIIVYFAFDLGHLMVKRTNVIEIENYDNYTQESGRQYIRHNSVGNTINNRSPQNNSNDKDLKPLSLPINPHQTTDSNQPLTDRSQRRLDLSQEKNIVYGGGGLGKPGSSEKNRGSLEPIRSYHTPPVILGLRPQKVKYSKGHSVSSTTSSPLVSPELDNLTIADDPFIMETPAYPSFNLQFSSFSPFRDNPMSRSPFSEPDDTTDDTIIGKSTSLTPTVFKITHWKDMGISPSTRSTNISSKITVSAGPVATSTTSTTASKESDSSLAKLDHFINMVQNPPSHLLKETESTLTFADYATILDKLIGS